MQVFHCKLIPNTRVITMLGRDSKSCKEVQNISTPIAIFYPPSDKYRGVIISRYTGQGEPVLTERQKWARDNFDLRDYIVCHLTAKSEFRAPKGSASQASAAAGSSSRRETVHSELFQDISRPESTCDPEDISHLETHTSTTCLCAVSVTSSLADSDLQAALAESQRGITELKDIAVKKVW